MQLYAESFIYSICLTEMLNSVSCVYADQFAIINIVLKWFALSTQIKNETCTSVTPSVNDCVSDALLNAAVQNAPKAFNEVSRTQKYLIS